MTVTDPFVVSAAAVFNLRDLGGRTASAGPLARGRVFRSGELADPRAAQDPAIVALGLHTVVDLRTSHEVRERPDHVPDGARYLHLDVLADMPPQAAADQARLMTDPHAFAQAFGGFDAVAQMQGTYRDLVVGDAARTGYAAFVRAVLAAEGAPVLVHCTAGKDRTGWATTLLLLAAGVDDDQVQTEYLAVNPAVRAAFAPIIARYVAGGGAAEVLAPMLEVRPEYLAAAFEQVELQFGGFAGYLRDGLGLADDEVRGLRALLVSSGV
ncbi:MAG: tyrosine-protein phosphatase [Cellulomonas sp.]|nr:tyrosine-protein phosphatase [Cellulomonas sp.]